MVPIHHRSGTYTPSPAQSIITATNHSPHGSHSGGLSAGPSPSTPTGSNSLTKIVVAQVYLLLSTIKEDKDRTKWEAQAEQLRKLIDDHGMEVFQKYFSRLVVGNAPQIFPGLNRTVANPGNYQILVNEVRKISHDVDQAAKIAESIETANEDLFRDFDLSTFMEHFKMDALEKTILALGVKTRSRTDLKTKADAILSTNFPTFLQILSRPDANLHDDLSPLFVATIVDRFIQEHPPNFNEQARADLEMAIRYRYSQLGQEVPPPEVLAALYLMKFIQDHNPLVNQIRRIGSGFTSDEETCTRYLHNMTSVRLDEEQVSSALLYCAISRTPELSTVVFLNSVRKEVSRNFNWPLVVGQFDREDLRVSPEQFLSLYKALKPLAEGGEPLIDIQSLWGGHWQYSETHISFISAYSSLSPDQLDATTIPGLQPAFTLDDYTGAIPEVRELALEAVKHPLVSLVALDAIFHVALQSANASDTPEAKRLFQKVVVPHLDVFLVSAFGIPKPWPDLANDTVNSLFDRFLYKIHPNYDFVLSSIWRKDMHWVIQRLVDTHARTPLDLPLILEHAVKHDWLYDLLGLNGFGLDFAALAHAEGHLDLELWQRKHSQHPHELAQMLLTFLNIKAQHELQVQRHEGEQLLSVMLPVKTISALLNILTAILPRSLTAEQMLVQRTCITAYPRLINYGEGFDDIIDANGRERNSLPKEANDKMEEHYKRMYSEEIKVRTVVEALLGYKHSRNPADQDVFACMIHGLFDEYALYSTYPLEALKTTAVLFGGIIKAKLLPDLPLEVALGMILDAVKDNSTDQPMYKFGLEALKQTLERFNEWPGFCRHLVHIPGLQGTDVWAKAEEVSREQDDASRSGNGNPSANESINGVAIANGNFDEMLSPDPSVAPFTSIHVDPPPYNSIYEEPSGDTQEKVLFVLNNITERNLDAKFKELKEVIEERHQQWFAGHLVEERAKMQPNYHQLYLDLVRLFENKGLWSEVLRETYVSVIRMLNAEATMQSSTERTHLKNLGGWLGSLTLARDKPIKHRNIAFKQLLLEAFDTQRLIVVIPFVCKVLLQGASSTVFKPPNPWLMDIIHLLIELYHHAELKLNLKFEIEVLCKGLNLDHKSIEPSTDIQTRLPPIDEPTEPTALEVVDRFDSLSMNGMSTVVGNGRFSPQDITSSIPDLGPLLVYPPANDMVNQSRLQDIVRTAITRAVHEIISPVVERSVTIAAISTAQMIHKDFATEPDENRVRSAAINMVKRTAGSLALVTSKEPLRASMSNYIRAASVDLPQGLPEGTIIMCVNSNLDMACSQVEKKAEERAIPEIEDMIEPELEARRRHRATRPNEPYVDPSLSRWAMTIPNPYKLLPGTPGGLNQEQMAIYDEFARQPRIASHGVSTHVTSTSDATRSMANDILQDQYPAVSNIPTPAEPPAMPHAGGQLQGYGQLAAGISNGRAPAPPVDPRGLADRITELLDDLVRTATNAHEQHYMDLPRPHPIIDIVDALISLIIRNTQVSDDASRFTAEHILQILFSQVLDDELAIESLVHVLEMLCKFPGTTSRHVIFVIGQQPDELLLSLPLVLAMIKTEIGLLDWQRVDRATAKLIQQHKLSALDFLSSLVGRVLLVDRPVALYTDFARSFEAVNRWLGEEPTLEQGQRLMESLKSSGLMQNIGRDGDDQLQAHKDQMGYVFDEWVNLSNSLGVTDSMINHFIEQLHDKQIVTDQENTVMFLRICIDTSVQRFEHHFQNQGPVNDAYLYIDALAKLIIRLVKQSGERLGEVQRSKMTYFDALVSLVLLVLNHHHVMRGEAFNQKVFFRLFSTMMCEFNSVADHFSESDRKQFYQVLAEALLKLQPSRYPGFTFGWISLISHRDFMPHLLRLPGQGGWEPLARLVEALLIYLGELLKQLHLTLFTKDIYRGTLKLLVVLHHDSPEFLAGYHARLCAAIPPHCIQLHNIILTAGPSAFSKMPDPLQPGLKIDRVEDIRESPQILADVALPLKQADLFDLVNQALQSGPSEDAVAHITHTIQRKKGQDTTAGYMAIHADLELIDSLVLYIGMHSIEKAIQKGGPLFIQGSPDAALLTMLVHELNPEARYYFLNSIVNQLRFPNAHTHYFSQALLEVFGNDMNDQEESDIRQQITRIMLERLIGPWPQPWGLLITIFELVKNDKYMFFDLPFIKSAPEVGDRFAALAQRAP